MCKRQDKAPEQPPGVSQDPAGIKARLATMCSALGCLRMACTLTPEAWQRLSHKLERTRHLDRRPGKDARGRQLPPQTPSHSGTRRARPSLARRGLSSHMPSLESVGSTLPQAVAGLALWVAPYPRLPRALPAGRKKKLRSV